MSVFVSNIFSFLYIINLVKFHEKRNILLHVLVFSFLYLIKTLPLGLTFLLFTGVALLSGSVQDVTKTKNKPKKATNNVRNALTFGCNWFKVPTACMRHLFVCLLACLFVCLFAACLFVCLFVRFPQHFEIMRCDWLKPRFHNWMETLKGLLHYTSYHICHREQQGERIGISCFTYFLFIVTL